MIHREWKLSAVQPGPEVGILRRADVAGIATLGVLFVLYAIVALTR